MANSDEDSGLEDNFQPLSTPPKLELTQEISQKPIPPPEAGLSALGHFIAETSREPEAKIIIKATHLLGRELALKYLEFALKTQRNNAGYLTKDGNRVRTVGGMFLRLLKDDPHVEPSLIKAIFVKKSASQRSKNVRRQSSKFVFRSPLSTDFMPKMSFSPPLIEREERGTSVLSQTTQKSVVCVEPSTSQNFVFSQSARELNAQTNPFDGLPMHKKPMFLVRRKERMNQY